MVDVGLMRKLAAVIVCLLLTPALAFPAQETVTVDFLSDQGAATHRCSGFLHAMSATIPGPELVTPLKPKLFRMAAEDWHHDGRGAIANYARVKGMGARMQIVVSDTHGYSLSNWWPGDNGDWTQWEAIVENTVKRVQQNAMTAEYDIWNEPDIGYFWKRDRERLFETWMHGYRKIRSLDPKAVIVGPSISNFNKDYLQAFLLYAKQNNVLPDILSWHEMSAYKSIPAHVDLMRQFVKDNGISIGKFCINEWIGPKQQTSPGTAARYFASGERAGIDGACHACWGDAVAGCSNCENTSLDGILTGTDKQPRSTWWAYKSYADVSGRLAKVTPGETVDGVAGRDLRSRTARVVLGRDGGSAGDIEMHLVGMRTAEYLIRGGKIHVLAERIPDSGWTALDHPVIELDVDLPVAKYELTVTLPNFGPSDAYSVTLRAPSK